MRQKACSTVEVVGLLCVRVRFKHASKNADSKDEPSSGPLQSVSSAALPFCGLLTVAGTYPQFGSQAAAFPINCKLSAQVHTFQACCGVSAHLQSIDWKSAARHQLRYEVQAPLQSVISAAICLLSHDMSASSDSSQQLQSISVPERDACTRITINIK